MMHYEIGLPAIVVLLLGAGLATLSTAAPTDEFSRQLVFLGLGVVACGLIIYLGQHYLLYYAYEFYALMIFLLILTKFIGTEVNGAQSWLYLGPLPGFQPSELTKLALVLVLARTLHEMPIKSLLDYIKPAILVGIPLLLILEEPDLGGALVIAAIGAGMMFVRGIPRRHVLLVLLLFTATVPTVLLPNLKPHQRARIEAFMNPERFASTTGYQVIQARIAIGSGGIWGKGYKQGTQSQLGFIPFRQTDFIFPVLAEEGGFVAAVTLLLIYCLLFWRLTVMAGDCVHERDGFIIVGILSLIGFQVLVNVGVTLGLAPVTGITLPLVSAGGTSLITTMMALALAYVIHRDRYLEW